MSDAPMVIGLSGLAGAGKTAVAEYLVARHGFTRMPFAAPLKAMVRAFGLTAQEMAGDLKEAPCDALCGRTPRQFMQLLGTEFGRSLIGPDLWVRAWLRQVDEFWASAGTTVMPARIVADDVRFPNEAGTIRRLGGWLIRIERPGAGSVSGAGHVSERLDFAPDLMLRNEGDLAALLARVDALVRDCGWARDSLRRATF